ncbi:MAG: hypothetical protein LBQ79_09400 [Deltaproteobacteria bacterium]|jgi:hypothetical protein|nr:hypothetical protein [Deltaproteobacteria bacterium]
MTGERGHAAGAGSAGGAPGLAWTVRRKAMASMLSGAAGIIVERAAARVREGALRAAAPAFPAAAGGAAAGRPQAPAPEELFSGGGDRPGPGGRDRSGPGPGGPQGEGELDSCDALELSAARDNWDRWAEGGHGGGEL